MWLRASPPKVLEKGAIAPGAGEGISAAAGQYVLLDSSPTAEIDYFEELTNARPIDGALTELGKYTGLDAPEVVTLVGDDIVADARVAFLDMQVPDALTPVLEDGEGISATIGNVGHVETEADALGVRAFEQGVDLGGCF